MGMDNKNYLNDLLNTEDLELASGGDSKNGGQQRLPGIRCPHCGNFIPTSIEQILYSSCLFCPTCGLKVDIDKRKHSPNE